MANRPFSFDDSNEIKRAVDALERDDLQTVIIQRTKNGRAAITRVLQAQVVIGRDDRRSAPKA